jgi:hypothetical protein
LAPSDWKGKGKEAAGRDEDCGGTRSAKQSKGKGGRKEKEAPAGGVGSSVTHKKKKKGEEGGLLREREKWAGGPAGLEREVRSFSFFSFFQTLFKFKPF